MATIAERYCTHFEIAADRYGRHALWRALPLQAQVAYPLLCCIPGYFDADLEFIAAVGRGTHLRDFAGDASDYQVHPDNRTWLRRTARLRVSSRKLLRHLTLTLGASTKKQEQAAERATTRA